MSLVNMFDKDSFLLSFKTKFENALKRMPIIPDKITVIDSNLSIWNDDDLYSYTLDFESSVETNIYNIRRDLYKRWFPTIEFSHRREESYSVSEIKDFLNKGISLEEALNKVKVIEEVETFKVNRIVVKRDEIFLKNIKDESDENMYQMTMPVTIFLKRLRSGKMIPKQAGEVFKDKSIFIKKIYPEKEWNKIIKDKKGD